MSAPSTAYIVKNGELTFSVKATAKPPSWGIINPMMKAPKMACMPIQSVKNALRKTRTMVTVIIRCVGPLSNEPVRRANQTNAGRTRKKTKRHQATATRRTQRAVRPEEAFTRAMVSARRIHPTTSLPTPAASTTTPTRDWMSLSSSTILARTGRAVIAMATPAKRRKWPSDTFV